MVSKGEACQILVSYLLPGTNYWKREIVVMPDKELLLAETLVLYQNEMRPYASRTLPHLEIRIWMGKWKGFWPVGVQFQMPSHQRSERGHETLKRLLCNNKLFDFQNWEECIN
jgi:hypothetical protein